MVYDIADLRIQIDNKYEYTTKLCQGWLSSDQASPVDIIATVTNDEILAEKSQDPSFTEDVAESVCLYRSICRQAPLFQRILMHAAVIEYDGNGYAFLARSGTGKSTHIRLWKRHLQTVKAVNGDKPILRYDKGVFYAYGTPWRGKEGWGSNTKSPLKALCFIERGKVNAIRRLMPAECMNKLFAQLFMPEDAKAAEATLALADKLLNELPCYVLQCDMSEGAVIAAYEGLSGKRYPKKEERYEN